MIRPERDLFIYARHNSRAQPALEILQLRRAGGFLKNSRLLGTLST